MASSDKLRVNIVVPCYNRETTVKNAVTSILEQDYDRFNVIVADDRSTDGTLSVLEAVSDERLAITSNEGPKGASGARNWGVAQGSAPFVAFQDSDDVWLPGKLSKQMARLEADENLVACYCAMAIFADGKQTGRIPYGLTSRFEGDISENVLRDSFISAQTVIIRRDVYEKVGGMDSDYRSLNDWELMIRVSQEGPIAFVDEVLVEQHMSSNSLTHLKSSRLRSQQMIVEKHEALLEPYPEIFAFHHNRISGALWEAGDVVEARKHAREAVRLAPFNVRYHVKNLILRFRRSNAQRLKT
ncbi:MAG: glycosyltransferase family A protein [Roseibium sp.]|uniref:glycosyltransferase family A protein n=1 Tax=Roseibium sp. TaxID=1936156 RepID=UPI003D9C141B